MATNAKRQVSIFVNGKEVEASAKNIANAYRQASNELGRMVIGSDQYLNKLDEVKRLDGLLKEHRQAVRGVEQGWNVAKGGMQDFIGIAAGAFTVDAIIGFGKELLNRGAELELLDRKARVVFGETFPLVNRAAEETAQAMGLTNAEYISAAANIQDLLVPMGFQRKEAAEMSTGLVDLSGALAQWSGGQRTTAEVSEILSKALLGERDALNSLGIDIKQAEVDAELLARGQDKLTGSAQKQAEAMVTLDLIMRKSTDAQTDFASGTESFAQAQGSRIATLREAWDRFGKTVIEALRPPSELERAAQAFDEQAMKVADLEQNIVPLLERYDELSSKTSLNADEQKELTNIIGTVGDVMPEAITGFNEYGEAIGINTELVREFVSTEKSRLEFVNQEQIKSLEIYVGNMKRWISVHKQAIEEIKAGTRESTRSMEDRVKELEGFSKKLRGAEAELARLRGQNLDKLVQEKPVEKSATVDTGPSPEETKAAEARAKEAAKKREQAAKDLEAHLARIQEIVKKNDEAAYLASLDADERALEQVRIRYQKEIETVKAKYSERDEVKKAVEALELQREAELDAIRQEQRNAAVEEELKALQEEQAKIEQFEAEYAEQKKAKEDEIKAFQNETILSEREQELLALEAHYAELLLAAEKYGLDTTMLKEAYAKKQSDIENKFSEKTAKEQAEQQKARLAALQSSFTAFSDLASATFDFLGGEAEEANDLQKVFTLAKIALDTASAISSLAAAAEANPANAITFGGAGIAQYIAGFARILANFAQVRKVMTSAPAVKQKAEGGFLSVIGSDDGRRYYARPLATPDTGMLPGFPVVFQSTATKAPVLASERGAEYFVAAHDLRNPYVANLVRMVDNITHRRGGIQQFQEGGANPPVSTTIPGAVSATAPALDSEAVRTLASAINNLNMLLTRGVVAVVPDRTITDINERFKEINEASGGFFT
jgi:hypothetical protein